MSEWKEYSLADLFEFTSGLSKPRGEFGFGYDFLSYKEIFNNYFVPDQLTSLVNSSEKERKSCSIKRGDVFLTRTSETDEELGLSSVALKDYPNATFNGFTKRLRPKHSDKILPEFAGFLFRSPLFRAMVSGMSSITTRASLNNGMLSEIKIKIPSIGLQTSISDLLYSLHRKIDLLHRQNKTLELLAETLFRQWFVEEANDCWGVDKLEDIAIVQNGYAFKSSEYVDCKEDNLEVLKMGHIKPGGGLRTSPKKDFVIRNETLNNRFFYHKRWLSNRRKAMYRVSIYSSLRSELLDNRFYISANYYRISGKICLR
jgi:type I restriction enzyme S subunit